MKFFSFVTTALAGASRPCAGLAGARAASAQGPGDGTVDWNGPLCRRQRRLEWRDTQAGPGVATTHQLTGLSAGAGTGHRADRQLPDRRRWTSARPSFAAGGQVGYQPPDGHFVSAWRATWTRVGGRASQFSSYALPATGADHGERRGDRPPHRPELDRLDPRSAGLGDGAGAALRHRRPGVRRRAAVGVLQLRADGQPRRWRPPTPGTTFGPFANAASERLHPGRLDRRRRGRVRVNHAVSVGAEYRHSDYGSPGYFLGVRRAGRHVGESTRDPLHRRPGAGEGELQLRPGDLF